MFRAPAFVGLAFAAGLIVAPAFGESLSYKADLSGPGENPPTTSAGTGHLVATFDTQSKILSWKVDYAGLSGEATMAHFHGPAPLGKNAGVMVPIKGSLASPIVGSAALTEAQAKALTAGDIYFNIHTAKNKAGEIRGQVEKGM